MCVYRIRRQGESKTNIYISSCFLQNKQNHFGCHGDAKSCWEVSLFYQFETCMTIWKQHDSNIITISHRHKSHKIMAHFVQVHWLMILFIWKNIFRIALIHILNMFLYLIWYAANKMDKCKSPLVMFLIYISQAFSSYRCSKTLSLLVKCKNAPIFHPYIISYQMSIVGFSNFCMHLDSYML